MNEVNQQTLRIRHNKAALWIAQSPNPTQALEETMAALETLLQALRIEKNG